MQHQQFAEGQDLLGSLCPGPKKLEGKTFYLDNVKKRGTALLLEAISLLGGRVESFLHKDVSFLVTGSQESLKEPKQAHTTAGAKETSEEAQRPLMQRESVLSSVKHRPATPRPKPCGSRGKALLEKAIRNNERLQGSNVLANARSWGVKILYVDDVLLYLKHLTRESFNAVHKKPERTSKQQGCHVVKAAALRSPYLKIEDTSRKYKPLHIQSMTFPTLCYSGRFSPFETPPPRFQKQAEQGGSKAREKKKANSSIQDKSPTPHSCNPSPWRPRKKDSSYCECCRQPFNNLEEHLQSDQHRAFALDASNYSVVDQLVVEMLPGFDPNPTETLTRPPTPLPICELEPLTDAETEHAVQALQRQTSSVFISSPTRTPPSSVPASPSPAVQRPIPPADIQLFTTGIDTHPPPSSPAMPVLDVEPQAIYPVHLQPDQLSPGPDTPCPSSDPYAQPPVLSPQVPCVSYIVESHCAYSDPPVLSPQCYPAEEAVNEHVCEMDTAESVSHCLPKPVATPHCPSVVLTNAEGVTDLNQETLCGFKETPSGLECAALVPCRSQSLTRQMATAQNPKKRCRSASHEQSLRKRRRITAEIGYSSSWNEHGQTSVAPESDIRAKPAGRLSFDKDSCQIIQSCPNPKVSSTCIVDSQTFTAFGVPAVQKCSQIDTLGHRNTSGLPSPQRSSAGKTPCKAPSDKRSFCSQDSQYSLSHSTSVCIESALIPDLAMLSSSSSDSDWDYGLMSRLGPTSAAPLSPPVQSCDKELLHTPCTWTHDTSYESRLHTVLQPTPPATSLCGEEMEPSAFSRTVVQIVEVQH